MVLLKNDGVLPLKTSGIKIAVVGPLADQTECCWATTTAFPRTRSRVLEGMRKRSFRGDTISYVPGTNFLANEDRRSRARGVVQADLDAATQRQLRLRRMPM